jgi:type 1 glutamine amidotransferase
MTAKLSILCAAAAALWAASPSRAQAVEPRFRVLVIAELKDPNNPNGDEIHRPYVEAAKIWFNKLAVDSNFSVIYLESPNTITDAMLANVDLVWQMNFTPYRWNATAKAAFEKYINAGKGGWLGQHHASLYGPVLTTETWPFFAKLIGEINYKNYISKFASGDVRVEEPAHPIFKGVPATFNVTTEEWYIWDKNPRPKVKVLANVDENSYKFVSQGESGIKMGDHPVIWTYEGYKARNLYIFVGHHPNLFQNPSYTTLLRNAIFWTASAESAADAGPKAVKARNTWDLAFRADERFITLPAGLHDVMLLDAEGHTLYRAAGKSAGRIDRSRWGAGRYLLKASTAKGNASRWIDLD